MQRRRAADGVDGGGDAADERTADQMMADLMEDLNNSSSGTTAVRSVRVLEGSAQAQPEGGALEAEHLPGGQQQAERAGGMDPGEGQRGDQRAQGVGDGSSCTSCRRLGAIGAST